MTSVLDYGYPYQGQAFLLHMEYRFRAQSVPCGSHARRLKLYDLHQMK